VKVGLPARQVHGVAIADSPVRGLKADPASVTNCSILEYRGRRLFAYRKGWNGAELYLSELDCNHRAKWNRRIKMPRMRQNAGGCEDPRLFEFGGNLHVEYIGVERLPKNQIRSHVLVARLEENYNVAETWLPKYSRRQHWEKNWGFFEHAAELFAVYSIHPHRVLRFDGHNVVEEIEQRYQSPWTHGTLRGGASPVLVGDRFYSFFHGTTETATGRLYSIGCYTFAAEPPFKPLAMTPTPILLPDQKDRPGASTPYVVFPCGALLAGGDRWLVSYGYYDKASRIVEFDAEQLDAVMVELK